jgi:predicted aspartyl protease
MVFAAGGPIHAPVLVNGVALTLMLDTGAARTVIAPDALARAGIDASRGRPISIVGVTGGAAAREVAVPRLDVAGRALGPLSVIAHEVGGAGVDGLLGRDVLDAFTLTVDPGGGRAVLTPR